ncbi:hypothetical protein IKO18_04065 [bacterium]|nr:hypothetical protein [bacterium]
MLFNSIQSCSPIHLISFIPSVIIRAFVFTPNHKPSLNQQAKARTFFNHQES